MLDDASGGVGVQLGQLREVYGVQLKLAQYPILAGQIRELMRQELFANGIISLQTFEAEIREKAIESQHREGLADPYGQESEHLWNQRLAVIRDQLTDFYFTYNFPSERLDAIIQAVLERQAAAPKQALSLTFNPEMAPQDLLFAQAQLYEALPPEQRSQVNHHLREIIVVLIKGMLSDQLEFVGIAKELFTIEDLVAIRRRCIGRGKIGGKAAGLLLARKMLQQAEDGDPAEIRAHVRIPDSYFIGADVFYDFQALNGFTRYMNQKYRSSEEITEDYPKICRAYAEGQFPGEIVYGLQHLLQEVGTAPLIVRSSSLLEVHFGAALAGKYESVFCPNQGTLEENLATLLKAVARVYASTLRPDALLYRRQMDLIDYDERMAVLIQKVQGVRYGSYFFPTVAGVGYSHNPFPWSPKIRREEGFLRLVAGFGTRAVERVANDYPRLVALSHPELRPYVGASELRKYTQKYIDVLDLNDNALKTLPIGEVVQADYPALRYLASIDKGEYIAPIFSRLAPNEQGRLLITFERLTRDRGFTQLMRAVLERLERLHRWPVDIEFTVDIESGQPHATYTLNLLQCRPQVSRKQQQSVEVPTDIPDSDVLLKATELVPHGTLSGIRFIVYVDPEKYHEAPTYETRSHIARIIGRLNEVMAGESFILVGPGRWGSSDIDLGVKVTYADIYNAKALVELPLPGASGAEPSYGTHFFQDLVEAGIHPLPVTPGKRGALLNAEFLKGAANQLAHLLPADAAYAPYVSVVDVPLATRGRYLDIVMNDRQELAIGYFKTLPKKRER